MGRRRTGRERAERKQASRSARWFDARFGIYADELHYFLPSNEGLHSVDVECDEGHEYGMPTGMYLMAESELDLASVAFRAGPCPICYFDHGRVVWGKPDLGLVEETTSGAAMVVADRGVMEKSMPGFIAFVEVLIEELASGEVDVSAAATRLRARGGPFTRVADWLERRPATAAVAATVLTSIVSLIGPQLARPDSRSDEEIIRIIDTILDDYDEVEPPLPDGGHAGYPAPGEREADG